MTALAWLFFGSIFSSSFGTDPAAITKIVSIVVLRNSRRKIRNGPSDDLARHSLNVNDKKYLENIDSQPAVLTIADTSRILIYKPEYENKPCIARKMRNGWQLESGLVCGVCDHLTTTHFF